MRVIIGKHPPRRRDRVGIILGAQLLGADHRAPWVEKAAPVFGHGLNQGKNREKPWHESTLACNHLEKLAGQGIWRCPKPVADPSQMAAIVP